MGGGNNRDDEGVGLTNSGDEGMWGSGHPSQQTPSADSGELSSLLRLLFESLLGETPSTFISSIFCFSFFSFIRRFCPEKTYESVSGKFHIYTVFDKLSIEMRVQFFVYSVVIILIDKNSKIFFNPLGIGEVTKKI